MQNCPTDFNSELKNIKFKKAFVSFLMDHWSTETAAATIIKDKEVYISHSKCYKYTTVNNVVCMQSMEEYKCEGHKEADTKFAFFLKQLHGPMNAVV